MHECPQPVLLVRTLARGDAGDATIRELAYKIASSVNI